MARAAEQLTRTVGEYRDFKAAERQRILRELTAELRRARERNAPWYLWLIDRANGTHRHGLRDEDSRLVACPVPGCDHGRGEANPHRFERASASRRGRRAASS